MIGRSGSGAWGKDRLITSKGNGNDYFFLLAFSRKIEIQLFAEMRHLNADDVVVEWIEVASAAEDSMSNVELPNWLIGSENVLTDNEKKHVAKLGSARKRGASGYPLRYFPPRIFLDGRFATADCVPTLAPGYHFVYLNEAAQRERPGRFAVRPVTVVKPLSP